MDLFPWLLFLHVFGAIIAFGPSYSFPIIGKMGGGEPQHANFATRVSLALTRQRVLPLAVLQGITGAGLVVVRGYDVTRPSWLSVAIVLYAIALVFAFAVQTPTVRAIVEMTSAPPPPRAPGTPPGPPPALRALIRRTQLGGMFLGALVAVIVFLMVVKPF